MYRRDLLTAEIQKLATVLAKILGLKIEDPLLLTETLQQSISENFNLSIEELVHLNREDLLKKFKSINIAAEQLDMLAKFITPMMEKEAEREKVLKPLLLNIYTILELDYHYLSFENIHLAKQLSK